MIYHHEFWGTYMLYWLFTVSVNVVMMNLLISIVSDVHDKTQSLNVSTSIKARCSILKETGEFMNLQLIQYLCKCFSRKQGSKHLLNVHRFVIVGQDAMHDIYAGDGEWEGRIKQITNKVDHISDHLRAMDK